MNSGYSNTSSADNIWVWLVNLPEANWNPGFSIPITPDTVISFDETGHLVDPQTGSPSCLVFPCGDTVSLDVEDTNGNRV